MRGIAFYENDFFTIKLDSDLYAENLKRLLMTNPGERPGKPFFGVGLRDLLFEMADEDSAENVKLKIKDQVALYLPTLTITKIETEIENNSLYIILGFMEKGDLPKDERILTFEFENGVAQ